MLNDTNKRRVTDLLAYLSIDRLDWTFAARTLDDMLRITKKRQRRVRPENEDGNKWYSRERTILRLQKARDSVKTHNHAELERWLKAARDEE